MTSAENMFAEPELKQVTVWTRGVTMAKEGRDVALALAEAAGKDGKYVQAFENYMDLPDRVYVPIRSYARISSKPIEMKYVYVNDAPDVVVLVEEGLAKGSPVLEGITPGAVLVVNSSRSPKEIAKFLPKNSNLKTIVTVDASGISAAETSLSGQEGATDSSGIAGGWAGAIAGAVVKATGIATLQSLEAVVKDKAGAKRGFETAVVDSSAAATA